MTIAVSEAEPRVQARFTVVDGIHSTYTSALNMGKTEFDALSTEDRQAQELALQAAWAYGIDHPPAPPPPPTLEDQLATLLQEMADVQSQIDYLTFQVSDIPSQIDTQNQTAAYLQAQIDDVQALINGGGS